MKPLSVVAPCLLVIQIQIQAVWFENIDKKSNMKQMEFHYSHVKNKILEHSNFLLSTFSNCLNNQKQLFLNYTVASNSYSFWADLLHKWPFIGYDWHP